MKIIDLIKKNKLLVAIMVLAFVLRFYKLGSIPPSLNPDEAALGYNAYSIMKTGRDEYGELMPLVFKSFGDFKPGFYIYLSTFPVFIFGLNEVSIRMVSALAGVAAVYIIYKLTDKLFVNKNTSLFAALFLALAPWHLIFSRGAWEVNLALTLTLAGLYFLYLSLEKSKYLLAASLAFSLTLITYQGAKLSTAVVILIFSIFYYKAIFKFDRKILGLSFLLGAVFALPVILGIFHGQGGRLNVFSIFSNRRPTETLNQFLSEGNEQVGDTNYYLFHSENYNFVRGILGRWFNHYSARFLFFEGDWQNAKHSSPYSGLFTFADFIFIGSGLAALMRRKQNKNTWLVWIWFLLAPLPSVLSRDEVHAVRSYQLLIPFVLIAAYGASAIFERYGKKAYLLIAPLYLFSYIYFLDSYFIHMPFHNSQSWDYGYKQIVETVTPMQSDFKMVRVQQSYSQPYIYFLFYQQYDPSKYQEIDKWIPGDIPGDVGKVEYLDNIYFGPIDWSVNRGDTDTLFVADPLRMPIEDSSDPKEFDLVRTVNYLNGSVAFRILSVKQR